MKRSTILEQSDGPAKRFASLGEPARLAILEYLRRDTHCLCEMQDDLGMAPNLLSYHMRILREAGLVSGRRNGRRVEYRIEPQGFEALCSELDTLAGSPRSGAPSPPDRRGERAKGVYVLAGEEEVSRR